MFDEIQIGFDGSPTSRAITPYVAWLARSTGARVVLVSATPSRSVILRRLAAELDADDIGGSSFQYPDNARLDEIGRELRARVEAVVKSEAEALQGEGVETSSKVVEGDAAEALVAAGAASADSIVALATHGRGGVERLFVGSVTAKVVREAKGPVLVLRPRGGDSVSTQTNEIIVPLDGSKRAEAALPLAKDLAAKLGQPIHLIRSSSLAGLGYGLAEDGPTGYGELAASSEQIAREYIAFIANDLRSQGVGSVVESVVDRAPDEAIVDAVGPAGDKLVVMTSHGRSGLNRMVLGSVTDQVMRHSAGPVLVVPSIGP